ncbi:protein yellow-like [Leptidea sinapis]|uniref:protein yellow-like n=1 Tax=Leptidea sinapis TaxID=189913 RepID=UPI0021C4AF7A|nr:protein yellow-like [Leptidea sinapis]
MDESGIQLYSLIDQNAIGCWNTRLPLKPQNTAIADKDDVGLVFPSDVKIDRGGNVWVMSDRMAVFLESELDYSDINFRVYTGQLDTLTKGTVCEAPQLKKVNTIPYQDPNPPQVFQNYENLPRNPQQITLVGLPSPYNPQFGSLDTQNVIPRVQNQAVSRVRNPQSYIISATRPPISRGPWWVKDYQVYE